MVYPADSVNLALSDSMDLYENAGFGLYIYFVTELSKTYVYCTVIVGSAVARFYCASRSYQILLTDYKKK